jgi:hypothetical protein
MESKESTDLEEETTTADAEEPEESTGSEEETTTASVEEIGLAALSASNELQMMSVDVQATNQTLEESLDTTSADLDAIAEWMSEYPEKLNAFYEEDSDTVAALASDLELEEDTIRSYAADLKSQNDTLVQALENGTDVLNIISMNTTEEAAEELGVTEAAITLFGIKLNNLSNLIGSDMEEAEENNELESWYQQLGKALEDEDTLSALASEYGVESAVLAALLQNMGVQVIDEGAGDDENKDTDNKDSNTVSITISNIIYGDVKGNATEKYDIYLWDSSSYDPLTGTYKTYRWDASADDSQTGTEGNVIFDKTKVLRVTADGDGIPYTKTAGYYYGYEYAMYGYVEVTLEANESITISGLPKNCSYTILQDFSTDYYLRKLNHNSVTGNTTVTEDIMYSTIYVQQATGHMDLEFVNAYALNFLRIGQKTTTNHASSKDDEFEYTVYLYKCGEDANTPLFDTDEIEIDIDAEGSDTVEAPDLGDTLKFTRTKSIELEGMDGKTGVYNVATIKLKAGQSVVFKNLGVGYAYYIAQTPNIHYAMYNCLFRHVYYVGQNGGKADDGSLDNGYMYQNYCSVSMGLEFVNGQESLSITKEVEGGDTTREFTFDIFLLQYSLDTSTLHQLSEGEYNLTYTNPTGDEPKTVQVQNDSGISFPAYTGKDANGNEYTTEWTVMQVTVAAGQTVTIEDLPYAVGYEIREVPVVNYTVTAKATSDNCAVGPDNNVYTPNIIGADSSATFINTFTQGVGNDLAVSLTVSGNLGDENQEFPVQITLTDEYGDPLSKQDIITVLPDGTESVRTTDETGGLTFEMKHGQQITLQDLPEDTKYTITETEADNYTTSFEVNGGTYDTPEERTQSGTMSGEDVQVQINNDLTGVKVPAFAIQKLVNGLSEFEEAKGIEFSFTFAPTGGSDCYTGDGPYHVLKETVIPIIGTGQASSGDLYFVKSGVYTYTLTENDLTGTGIDGYTKDSTQYDITIVVETEDQVLKVTSVTFVKHGEETAQNLAGAVLTFNNIYEEIQEDDIAIQENLISNPIEETKADTSSNTDANSNTDSGTVSGTEPTDTGDNAPIGWYGMLFGVSALLLIVAGNESRCRRHGRRKDH